jgi:hypothetical protein
MAVVHAVDANNRELLKQVLAVPPSVQPDITISGFPEYDTALTHEQRKILDRFADQIVDSQAGPFPVVAFVITGYADKDLRANNPDRKPGETHAQFELRISESRAITARARMRARIRHRMKQRGSTPVLEELLADPRRTKAVAMGATDLLVKNPRDESERAAEPSCGNISGADASASAPSLSPSRPSNRDGSTFGPGSRLDK